MKNLQQTEACLDRNPRGTPRRWFERQRGALTMAALVLLSLCSSVARAELVVSNRQKLVASDALDDNYFGTAVAIDADTAVVSRPLDANNAGAVYLFVRNASGTWQPHPTNAKLVPAGLVSGDSFGSSVSLSGQSLVVGAPGRTQGAGTVYAFRRAGTAATTSWTLEQQITPSGLVAQDDFGGATSLSVDTLVVGARFDTAKAGAAYAFLRGATTPPWTLQNKLLPPTRVTNATFGYSVGVSGNVAVIGSPGQSDPGQAFVFRRVGAVWGAGTALTVTVPSQAPPDFGLFGTSVAISSDWIVVGAPETPVGSTTEVGAVYFFARNNINWVFQQRIDSPSPFDSGEFGTAVAIVGTRALVGAPAEPTGFGQGRLFELVGTTTWQAARASLVTGLTGFVGFGATVALSADAAIGGASDEPCDPDGLNCTHQGSAYAFALSTTAAPVPALRWPSRLALTLAVGGCGVWLLRRQSAPIGS